MIKRFLTSPNQSFFLFGPRGTGKSTWLKASFPNGYFIDLLDPTVQIEYLTNPGKLLQVVRSLKNGTDVKCLTPDYQVISHTGYKLKEKDYKDVSNLCAKFNIELLIQYSIFILLYSTHQSKILYINI